MNLQFMYPCQGPIVNRQRDLKPACEAATLRKLQRGSNLVFINPVVPATNHANEAKYLLGQLCRIRCTSSVAGNMLIHTIAKPYRSEVNAAGEEREGTVSS